MKRRAAYAAFEKRILDLYERKLLKPELLDRIASQYCLVGIDSAGSKHVRTHDGKDLHQVCIELVDPTFPIVARGSSEDHEEYWEQELKKWEEIVHKHWGWHAYGTTFPSRASETLPSAPYPSIHTLNPAPSYQGLPARRSAS